MYGYYIETHLLESKMYGYLTNSVIERNGVIGIICGWEGSYCRIMFEDGTHGVDFATYTLSAVARFRVIG